MSDPRGGSGPAQDSPADTAAAGESKTQDWLELVSEFGADVAGPLTAALERIDSLTASGRITRADLRALRDEVARARQAGLLGQQLTILASGRLRHSPERLSLDATVDSVLGARAREVPDRDVRVEPASQGAEVIVDATLLFSLLNTVFDWVLANSIGRCEFKTVPASGSGDVRLECSYETWRGEVTGTAPVGTPPRLNALTWRILEQTAAAMGLTMRFDGDAQPALLTLQFVCAAPDEGGATFTLADANDGFAPASNPRPLAGSQVLVISSRREMRVQIRDALRSMGLMIDFVSSVNEAAQFCEGGVPDAIVIEAIQRGERFARFREELQAKSPHLAFIEVVEQGRTFEKSGFGGTGLGRVGRDVIDTALPAALVYELTKGA